MEMRKKTWERKEIVTESMLGEVSIEKEKSLIRDGDGVNIVEMEVKGI